MASCEYIDLYAENSEGKTPKDIACNNLVVYKILKKYDIYTNQKNILLLHSSIKPNFA